MPTQDQEREELERKVLAKRVMEKRAQEESANQQPVEATVGEKAMAAASGISDSITMGYMPELQAAAAPYFEKGLEFITGTDLPAELEEGSKTFEQRLQERRSAKKSLEEKAPNYTLGGQVVGAFVPGTAIAKGVTALSKTAKAGKTIQNLARGASGAGTLAQKAKGLATVGAIEGAVYNPNRDGKTDGDINDRLNNAVSSAAFGGAIPVAGKVAGAALKKGLQATQSLSKGVLSVLGGVELEKINTYLKNPEIINNAPEFETVKNAIDDVIRPIRSQLNNAEIDVREATKRVEQAQEILSNNFKEKNRDILEAFRQAKENLNMEFKYSYDNMNKVKPPNHLTDAIVESVDQLKTNVIRQSNEALDSLVSEVKAPVDISGAADVIQGFLDDLTINGRVPKHSEVYYSQLKGLQDDINQFGGAMAPADVKKYIKQLDTAIDIADGAGTFASPDNKAKVALRRHMDEIIKTASPTYRAKMEAVAEDAALLSQTRKLFGNTDRTMRTLNSIDSDLAASKRDALFQLGERTGRNYKDDVIEYIGVSQKLKNLGTQEGKDDFVKNLSGFEDYEKARARLDFINSRDDLKKKEILERATRMSDAQKQLEIKQTRLENLKEADEMVKTFSVENSEKKIESMIRLFNSGKSGRGMELRQEFQKLSSMADQDFEKMINAVAMKETFDKSFIRGSRNVNLWSSLGAAASSAFGNARSGVGASTGFVMGGPVGAAIGASLGAINDFYGPKITKKILDQVLSIKGMPTVTKINNLELPPDVKKDLIMQFEQSAINAWSGRPIEVDPEDIPSIREDIRRNANLTDSEKARVLSDLNKGGIINNGGKIFGEYKEKKPEQVILEKRLQQDK